jgi:hypothetical protein
MPTTTEIEKPTPSPKTQAGLILAALQSGRRLQHFDAEKAEFGHCTKLDSRISDLRAAGHEINGCRAPGEKHTVYWIEQDRAVRQTADASGKVNTRRKTKPSGPFFQHDDICQCGKSFWVISGKCNRCGIERQLDAEEKIIHRHAQKGRLWSKAKHRYLTEKEIKNGERGG